MTIVNIFGMLLIMSIFSENLKQKQYFVRKWQHFILFICNLGIDPMTCLDKTEITSLRNMLFAQNLDIVCKVDQN